MKKRFGIVVAVALVGLVFAGDTSYYPKLPPRASLPSAYKEAVDALGMTNRYHCIGASLTTNLAPRGGWLFNFSSINGELRWVVVPFGEQPIVGERVIR